MTASTGGVVYWTNSDPVDLPAATAALATSIANTRAVYSYRWADATARGAQTGMFAGDRGWQTDTAEEYTYIASAWKLTGGTLPTLAARRTAAQSIPNNSFTTVLFNAGSSVYTSGAITFNPDTGTLTMNRTGIYRVHVSTVFNAGTSSVRSVRIQTNGITSQANLATTATLQGVGTEVTGLFNSGDAITFDVFQLSGGALNINASGGYGSIFSAAYLGSA